MNRDKEYIRNGYWFMCISVLMFLLLFHFGSSQLVQYPYSSVDDFYSKYQIFPKLEVNDKDTLEAEFKVLNPLLQEIDVEKSSLNVLEIDFDKVCGDVIDYTFEYKTNCTKEIKTPVLKKIEICGEERGELYAKDGCIIDEVVDYYITSYEEYECWQETDKLPIGVNSYKIKVNPKISDCGNSWGYKIDWIPTLKTTNTLTGEVSEFTKEEWAWFNSTWKYRNMLNVSHIDRSVYNASVKVKLNTTNFNYSLANTTGQDIRFALENGTMLDHYIQSWNTSGESRIWVRMPYLEQNTNTTIYIYYGNPEAVSISNMTNVFGTGLISFWDFDNNILDVWGQNNGTVREGVDLYNISSTGDFNSSKHFIGNGYEQTADDVTNISVGSSTIDITSNPITIIATVNYIPSNRSDVGRSIIDSIPLNGYGVYTSTTAGDADESIVFGKIGSSEKNSGIALISKSWQNMAVKLDKNSNYVSFYTNGSQRANVSYSVTFTGGLDYGIGGGARATSWTMNGSIDYIRVYNRFVSDDEINNLSLVYEPTISYFGNIELNPSEVWFGAYDSLSNPVTLFDVTINNTTQNNSVPFMLQAGAYNATFSKEGWFNQTIEINVTALSNSTFNFTGLYQSIINFIASKYITDEFITDFYVTINNVTKPSSDYWYVRGGDYIVTFSKAGWFNKSIDIHVVNGSSETYTFTDIYDKIWMIYAVDLNGNNLTEFEVNLSNYEYSWLDMWYTYVGYIEVPVLSSFSGTTAYYNLSFASIEDGGYFPRVYINQDTASDFVAELHQAEIRFNLTEIDSGTPLTSVLINNVLSNLTAASSTSSTWSIKKVFQTNATLVPYAISTLRMSRNDYSAELIHEFFYNDSSKVNTSTLSTSSLTDVEYTILNPYPDKLVDSVNVWLRRNASAGTAYSNYTYVYLGEEYTGATIYASLGEQSFYFVNRPYLDLNYTVNVSALSNNTINLEMYTNEIWLYGTRSQVLENFTCTYEGKVMYSNPYRISNILTPTSNMSCTLSGFKPATVSPSISTPANESFYLDELTTTSFPIYIYDERNLTEISNVTLYVFGEEPYVFNWTNSSRTIAVNGSGVTGMLFIKDGYINEEYYIDISDVYGYINVYMLPANASFNTTFTLQDNINTPIRDGFVDIYRFHPSLVSYVLVTTDKTDQNGNATIPLELNAFYKVKTRQILSSIPYNAIDFPFMPASTEFLVRYGLTEAEQNSAIIFMNMVYNLSYSKNGLNQTIFKLTFNDLSGIVRSGCLKVIEKGVTTNIPLCTNCLNASAGEILCVINQSDYVNTISGWGEFDTTTIHSKYNTPAKDVLKEEGYLDLGTAGLFVTFLLTATGLIAGLFISVPVGLMFLVATLILAIGTGLFWMQISSIVSLIILILLIIFKR